MVTLPYTSGRVGWSYNASSGRWNRSRVGTLHTDRLTGKQLTAANVVVVYVNHQLSDIREDSLGSRGIEIQLWVEGAAKVLRDGKVIDGKWSRPTNGIGLNFTDANGQAIPLKPGNTWIELVPIGFNIVVPCTFLTSKKPNQHGEDGGLNRYYIYISCSLIGQVEPARAH